MAGGLLPRPRALLLGCLVPCASGFGPSPASPLLLLMAQSRTPRLLQCGAPPSWDTAPPPSPAPCPAVLAGALCPQPMVLGKCSRPHLTAKSCRNARGLWLCFLASLLLCGDSCEIPNEAAPATTRPRGGVSHVLVTTLQRSSLTSRRAHFPAVGCGGAVQALHLQPAVLPAPVLHEAASPSPGPSFR